MAEISSALPATPVTLAARAFRQSDRALTDAEMAAAIDRQRSEWRDRVWLPAEKNGEEIWAAAREILLLRRLIEEDEAEHCKFQHEQHGQAAPDRAQPASFGASSNLRPSPLAGRFGHHGAFHWHSSFVVRASCQRLNPDGEE